VVGAGVLAAAVIGFAGINSYLPGGGDNAGYIAEAESLLAHGRRLSLYEAGTPPATLKPPLFPVMLAGVEALVGRNVAAMKALLVFFALGAVFAAWWALRRGLTEGDSAASEDASSWAAWIACWFALTPTLTLYTHDVLSDVPFTAAALAAVALVGGAAAPGARWWHTAALLGTLIAATLLRSAGLILCGACTAYLLVAAWSRRREAGTRQRVATAGLLCLLAVLFLASSPRGESSYFTPERLGRGLSASAETAPAHGDGTLAGRVSRMATFYGVFLTVEIAGHPGLHPRGAIYAAVALAGIVWAVGLVTMLRRRQFLIPLVWLIYQAALLAWPFADPRFYLPTLPLFLCMAWVGGSRLFEWTRTRGAGCTAAAVFLFALVPVTSIVAVLFAGGQRQLEGTTVVEWSAGAVLLGALILWLRLAPAPGDGARSRRMVCATVAILFALGAARGLCENVLRERRAGPAPEAAGWPDFHEAAQWLKAHAQPDDPVMSAKPSLVWYWSGLRGIPIPEPADAARAERAAARAEWIVLDGIAEDRVADRFAQAVLLNQRERWLRCWVQGNTAILRRRPAAAPAGQ
jgi:4-amino-4-deoxy-L-arabinose transferase-like glycosyltransferase